ncbi:tRNA 4-thiouridine(8) synthase ThiI [Candidatus Pacearchaeota archaeon]|jgi:hypothetical protein|nr:tRNA 4-thiouridine(8) synthase ThiI [Candidatus Pacearchaeota archaeon]|tara:strand:+ start:14925 stop:15851 length:927 start_codon:yes stop_codon:yes gene_type:complete
MKKKCIVMLSGGLDSRLAIKIMQEQGFEVLSLFFKLPVGTGCCDENCSFSFSQTHGVKLKIFDCTKKKLLDEYLSLIKKPKYKRGAGINPCIDCRIFMFKKAREFADKNKIDLIVTGEVLGERPMSQKRKAMDIIEDEAGLKGRLLRPLSAKLLEETEAEKKGLVNRKKLYNIEGRNRKNQMELAKKFNITYPTPAGGCLLCEKELIKRFNTLLKRNLNEDTINLIGVGRHFIINDIWIVLGRNEKENKIIEFIGKKYDLIIPEFMGPSAIILDKSNKKIKEKVNELIITYSKKGNLKNRKKFEKYKL